MANNGSCPIAQEYGYPINTWCVGAVTNMHRMFEFSTFNEDISGWDVSSVTYMLNMFNVALSFNSDISSWDVSSVTTMNSMFDSARAFNQDVSSWNVSRVTNMQFMFREATSFNINLCAWNETFPYDNARYIFGNSGCNIKDQPSDTITPKGPFCASNCIPTTTIVYKNGNRVSRERMFILKLSLLILVLLSFTTA